LAVLRSTFVGSIAFVALLTTLLLDSGALATLKGIAKSAKKPTGSVCTVCLIFDLTSVKSLPPYLS